MSSGWGVKRPKVDAKYLHKFVNEYDHRAVNFFNESSRLSIEAMSLNMQSSSGKNRVNSGSKPPRKPSSRTLSKEDKSPGV